MYKQIICILTAAICLAQSTFADSVTLSETYKDLSYSPDSGYISRDTGTITASYTVPGLSAITRNDWSNLLVSISMYPNSASQFSSDTMSDAPNWGGTISATTATFFFQGPDTNFNYVNVEKITFSHSGDTLTITDQALGPAAVQPPFYFLAENYTSDDGPFTDSQTYEVSLLDNLDDGSTLDFDVAKTLFITGTNTITSDADDDQFSSVVISGTANFSLPILTQVSPAGSISTSTPLLTNQVNATSSQGVANVEFYWNGQDFGGGSIGSSGRWSQIFSLAPGANTFATVATDVGGNNSTTNSIIVTYANKQTNAPVIQFSEQYLDSAADDGFGDNIFSFNQDVGALNAALAVPGLQAMSANTWSNLQLSLSFGDLNFSNQLSAADVLTPTSATFYATDLDPGGNTIRVEQLTVTRTGDTLILYKRTGNPTYSSYDNTPIIADMYYGTGTAIHDQQTFSLALVDGNTTAQYANISQVVYIKGTDAIQHDSFNDELDNIQVSGQADYTPPVTTITAPTQNQLWSNSVFTVQGKASDNILVTNVLYSINNSDWMQPNTANNWTNWTVQVNLIPGTNTITAYSVDSNNNISATNKVNLVYVLSAQLTVNQIGVGSITPNYNNVLLPIGNNFSMTARGTNGFQFTSWTGSISTNGATLQFTMASNLVFTANFADTNRPTVTVTAPTSGQLWSNSTFTIQGKATDNALVTNVYYSINNSDWTSTTSGNNWTNWTSLINLIPGTNTLLVYSVDASGNLSPTNKVNLVYVLSAPLTVSQVGVGSITPNYNNVLLPIGKNFSMVARGTNGFQFTSWTGSISTNGATLQFTMASNLVFTANFADTNRPTVTVTAPTSGQLWSNSTFTIQGKATDNALVTNVYYSINSSDWVSTTSGNNWTNWTSLVNLTPGTNTLLIYSVDASGNVSPTNKVNLVYILSAPLIVNQVGVGSITPNYNNVLLAIGKNFSMVARGTNGFQFTGWTGSITTNGATLQFTMASNLVFTANFADTNRPTISVTNLIAGQRVSNDVFTVKGTARDNWLVGSVIYQLNGAGWSNAVSGNTWTNWSADLNLIPGTNNFKSYAVDTTGNVSATNNFNFFHVVSARLQIQTTGLGRLSPNYSNALLAIGQNYSITSTPSAGFVFTNWVVTTNGIGSGVYNRTNLQFMMVSNLMLQANFVDISKPSITILTPTANQKMTNAIAAVTGTATDNWKVTAVWYRLNGGAWILAPTTNNWTNWSQTITLVTGTNKVEAYAQDLGGNYSGTNSVNFTSGSTFAMQLVFNSLSPLMSNGLAFSLQASTNLSGHIQYSTNLTSWLNLTTFKTTNSTLNFRDPAATNSPQRFYRATIP